jgi:hypothetical protein
MKEFRSMKKMLIEYASRRGIVQAGLALLATGVTGTAALAQADNKAAQSLVQYQPKPKGAAKCGVCVNFEAPNACKVVAGKIDSEGWCLLYAPKGA